MAFSILGTDVNDSAILSVGLWNLLIRVEGMLRGRGKRKGIILRVCTENREGMQLCCGTTRGNVFEREPLRGIADTVAKSLLCSCYWVSDCGWVEGVHVGPSTTSIVHHTSCVLMKH